MPTNNTHGRAPSTGTQNTDQSTSRTRQGDRSRSKHNENGNRSRTKFADRARRRGRILIALAAACAAEVVYALLTAPALNVRHTVVNGITNASLLAKDEFDKTSSSVSVPPGTNWLLAPVGRIHAKVTDLPWIRSAAISRRLPTDLVIAVEPRTPYYSLITPCGRYEVGADNTPIRPLRREMENQLIPVFLNSSDVPKPGAVFANIQVGAAQQILQRTRGDSVLRIAKIEIDQTTNIWLNMSTGVRIKFGHCEDVDKKIAMMRRLLSHGRGSRFAQINVSSPDWPAGTLIDNLNQGASTQVATVEPDIHTRGSIGAGRKASAPNQSGVR